MSRKRVALPGAYRSRKRICSAAVRREQTTSSENGFEDGDDSLLIEASISDTKAAFLLLERLFPVDKFEGRLPPIVVRHQLYSIINNRSLVDAELELFRRSGAVRLLRLGSEELCLISSDIYRAHALKSNTLNSFDTEIVEKFVSFLSTYSELSIDMPVFESLQINDQQITLLIRAGLLIVRDVGSWWISVPGAGVFMKSLIRGRKAVLTMLRKCKYQEMLQSELELRKLPRIARLGMQYHIHDLVGASLVDKVNTTSGVILRHNCQ